MPEEPRIGWFLPETLAYLTHLQRLGEVTLEPGNEIDLWAAAATDSNSGAAA